MPHALRPLARNHTCQVEHCADCSALHVTVGPVTLRLRPDAAASVRDVLHHALARLAADAEAAPASSHRSDSTPVH